jgi:lipoate-protein ligase B
MHSMKHMTSSKRNCVAVDLGVISYTSAYELQQRVVAARKAGEIGDVFLLCEHPHVITLGRNGKAEHLQADRRLLWQMNVEFHDTDRGGDITYHGPGQLVGYPILDLTGHRRDVRWYVQMLEEAMIRTSADFGIAARRVEGRHGLWVNTLAGEEEKLAAIGVHLSRWVTSHGFAYNVSTDLRYFDLIVPCGILGKRATSLERLLNCAVRLDEVKPKLTAHFSEVFDREIISMSCSEFEARLANSSPSPQIVAGIVSDAEFSSAGAIRGI